MIDNNNKILDIISEYILKNPDQRFGQILFNLNITNSEKDSIELRDIYYDSNEEILKRIKKRVKELNKKIIKKNKK